MTEQRDGVAPGRELATVTRLPARVVDAEIVDERPIQQVLYARRMQGYRSDVTTVARVVRAGVTHPHTVTTARAVGRHTWHIGAGIGVIARRAWEAKTNSRYERILRGAEATGNWERLEEWETRAEHARERRHRRFMDWLEAPLKLAKAFALIFASVVAALLALGILLAFGYHDITWTLAPLRAMVWLIVGVVAFVTVAWVFILVTLAALAVTVCWHVGRNHGVTPAVLAPANVKRHGEDITAPRVVLALRDLGIPALRKAIADAGDGAGVMLSSIAIAGCGVEVDVTLPVGVTTAEVMSRRRKLAENLDRHEHEVYVTVAPRPRTVTIWAADSGALDEPIGPSPLVLDEDYRADYRRGKAPWGENLRGDALPVSLYQRHVLVVGLSNQGKTKTMRALALYLALDLRVEFRVADLKGAGDWAMLADLATVLIEGPSDQHVIAATEMLEDGVREMDRRLTDGGPWEPLILIVDEAQQAYMCPEKDEAGRPYGGAKSTSRYLTAVRKIQNQGRAVDVLLWQGTQNPTNQNLPVLAREGAHLRICTAVGTEEQSRMALGDKAVDGGAAPHLLRAGLDRGTVVVAGDGAPLADGQSSVTVRTHFIDDDAAAELAARAVALRGPVRRRVVIEQDRDLLADVLEALRDDDMVAASDMAARLRELATEHGPYRSLTGKALAELLRAEGVEVRELKGVLKIRRERVQRAWDDRPDLDE